MKYIIEYDTRRGEHIYPHREVLHTMYDVYDLMLSLDDFINIHSGEVKHTENLRGDKIGNTYYPILATINGEELQFGITNFEIPSLKEI